MNDHLQRSVNEFDAFLTRMFHNTASGAARLNVIDLNIGLLLGRVEALELTVKQLQQDRG